MNKKTNGQENELQKPEIPLDNEENREKMLAIQNSQLPIATHKGILKIHDAEIQCFVLDDGRRVLSGRAVTNALGLSGRGPGMDRFLLAKSLQPYIDDDLKNILGNPIQFQVEAGIVPPQGYEAGILPELCNAVIEANENGKLRKNQQQMVAPARILLRGFAKVGIIALVDEATGYQDYRARQALEQILERFLKDELAKWAKRFPDEFYKQLFKLRGWEYKSGSVKRPSVVGTLTNDIVYSRLAPGVLDELKRRTPRDDHGRAKVHFHQWLTEDVGHPKLQEHLAAVIALMKASPDWRTFERLLNRALPKLNETLPLELYDDNGLPM